MEALLQKKFTLYISKENNELKGCAMKATDDTGLCVTELSQEELNRIQYLQKIDTLLEQGNLLQIYQNGFIYSTYIGQTQKEGPYGEEDCFDVIAESNYTDVTGALLKLENSIPIEKNNVYKKMYRYYGEDKYTTK